MSDSTTSKQQAIIATQNIGHRILNWLNTIVLLLSAALIVWISIDTFEQIDFLNNSSYMKFQFWVCVVFILDFFVGLYYAENRRKFFRKRIFFLLVSIPYLNIINLTNIQLSPEAIYFVRFIPLARAALAMSIVIGYLSSNAVTSLTISYLTILLFITYFCSLILYQRESPVNPDIHSYWTALWWCAMNMTTVGCSIPAMTIAGKIIEVVLPICGMIVFPLFTIYFTNYVTNIYGRSARANKSSDNSDNSENSEHSEDSEHSDSSDSSENPQ